MEIRVTGADDYGRLIKALIVGEPGSGKTLISSTFPKPFYVSAEGGLMSIADKQIPYAEVTNTKELTKALDFLRNDGLIEAAGLEVETVVVDTIDQIQRFLKRERMVSERVDLMRQQDWGWLGDAMTALCEGFRNLPYHVVFTCHVKEVSDDSAHYFRPALQGAIVDQLPGMVDLSLALQVAQEVKVEDDKATAIQVRKLMTFPSKKYPFLKDRSGKLPKELEVDLATDFEKINDLIFGDLDLPESGHVEVDDQALELGMIEVEPEPEGLVTNEAVAEKVVADAKDAVEDEESDPAACEVCGVLDLGDVDPKMGKILFRKTLCREHFDEAKKQKDREKSK